MRKIPDYIIERAAELWGRKIHRPVFDNGDQTRLGGYGMALATLNIHADKENIHDMEERVEKFKKSLIDALITTRDSGEHFNTFLDTDYHPCKELVVAADEAGIPYSQFSCKSTVHMMEDCVSASFGYGAENIYHYKMPDNSWLITTLRGSDIAKIIDLIMGGDDLGLTIENHEDQDSLDKQ